MQEIPLNLRFLERGLSKSLKKVNYIYFLSNLVLFKGQDNKNQIGLETSDQSLIRLQNKFRKICLLY